MNEPLVDKLARALLYEGYALYPYRPSVKNQQRWTFGGVYPPSWSQAQEGTDPCVMQTQCLLETTLAAKVRVKLRFLQLVERTIGQLLQPLDELPAIEEPLYQPVRSLGVGDRQYLEWQEAVEREVDLGELEVTPLLVEKHERAFAYPNQRTIEPLRAPGEPIVAILIRRMVSLEGAVELSATALEPNLVRITVRVLNRTEMADAPNSPRDAALMRTLVSTHTILEAHDGKFVSQTDPPAPWQQHAAQSSNIGVWPVLVGDAGATDTMLASPIIVEDYPKIAAESPGDLFDATEIDEILTLRIMTLTEDEKRLAAGVDERVRDLLARTHALDDEQLRNMHGTLRGLTPLPGAFPGSLRGPLPGAGALPGQNPGHPDDGRARLAKINAHGVELKAGDPVRLRPLGRADMMDIALDGKAATIVSIEQDFEDRIYVAVTVDDDPGKDLGLRGQPGHRFFFGIEEVEPLSGSEVAS